MKFISVCLLGILFWACNICSKKVACPPFYDEVLPVWFPYQGETRLNFATAAGATQSFYIDTITESNNPDVVWQNERDHCTATRQGASTEKDASGQPSFSFRLIKNGYYDASVGRQMEMRLLGLQMSSSDVRKDEFRQLTTPVQNTYMQNLASVNLDGKQFYNVLLIRMDTSGAVKPPVHKIYFVPNQGIVAYETYSPALLWVIQ